MATAHLGLKKILSYTNILHFFEHWVPYDDGKIVRAQPRSAVSQCPL